MTPIRTYRDAWNGAVRTHRRTGLAAAGAWALPLERPAELPAGADAKPAPWIAQKNRRTDR